MAAFLDAMRCDATRVYDTVAKSVKFPSPIALMLDGVDRPPCKTQSSWLGVVPIVSAPDELSIQAWIRCPWYGRFPQVESASLSRISMKQLQRSRYRYGQHRGSTGCQREGRRSAQTSVAPSEVSRSATKVATARISEERSAGFRK